MIVVTATLKAQPGKEGELEAVLRRLVEHTQGEDGTLAYALHRSAEDPTVYLFYERYADQEALQRHTGNDGFRALGRELAPYLAERPQLARFELVAEVDR
ncbi:MAG TPA: putative quinol monooxygenase [Dehalococcoidia bacterium]